MFDTILISWLAYLLVSLALAAANARAWKE